MAGIDLGGDAAWNDGENLFAEGHGEIFECQFGDLCVIGVAAKLFLRVEQHVIDDLAIVRHLRGCRQQRRVRGRILGPDFFNRLDIAGVGHHGCHFAELCKQCFRHPSPFCTGQFRNHYRPSGIHWGNAGGLQD
jgi:hypothetical protein